MNIFQLVLKQMRQRALGTWLTLLSVTLGVALAITILVLYREAGGLFGQTDYGYDVLVGKEGSGTQLVMNTVYHLDASGGNIPYSMYTRMLDPDLGKPPGQKRRVRSLFGGGGPTTGPTNYFSYAKIAIPFTVGDSYQGKYRIIGTTTNLFGIDDTTGQPLDEGHTMYVRPGKDGEPGQKYEFAEGQVFHPHRFEAVIGSEVARLSDLKMGSQFQATHGVVASANPDIHPEKWVVTGVLKPTHTANDRCVFIPILSSYTVEDHALGLKTQWILQHHGEKPPADADPDEVHSYKMLPNGDFELFVPHEYWEVSAIAVKGRSSISAEQLIYALNNSNEVMAVNPASVMREFFSTFLKGPTLVLLAVAILVTVVAAVGILVSIYNSVSARLREIAILRALGATRNRVLSMICLESMFIGIAGGLLGLLVGHGLAGVSSHYFNEYVGEGIRWATIGGIEWAYIAGVVVVALLAGVIPAAKAYRTPVATNLVAG
jgi:putative ABC transport system permease protein